MINVTIKTEGVEFKYEECSTEIPKNGDQFVYTSKYGGETKGSIKSITKRKYTPNDYFITSTNGVNYNLSEIKLVK